METRNKIKAGMIAYPVLAVLIITTGALLASGPSPAKQNGPATKLKSSYRTNEDPLTFKLKQKLARDQKLFGASSPQLYPDIEALASREFEAGNLLEAEELLRHVQGIGQTAASPSSSNLKMADLQVLLARVCDAEGRHGDGMQFAQAALEIQLKKLPENSPALLPTEMTLFDIYRVRKSYDKAETAGRRVVSNLSSEKTPHTSTLFLWKAKLADLLDLSGNANEAARLLATIKGKLPQAKQLSTKDRENYASTLLVLGELDARHSRFLEAQDRCHKALSYITAPVLVAKCNKLMAELEASKGNFPAAEKVYLQTLLLSSLQPIDRGSIYTKLAELYIRKGFASKAINCLCKALPPYIQSTGVQSPCLIYTLRSLCALCSEVQNYTCARSSIKALEQAISYSTQPHNEDYADLMLALAAYEQQCGNLLKSEKQLDEARKAYSLYSGESTKEFAETLKLASQYYITQGKIMEAGSKCATQLPIYRRLYGDQSDQVEQCLLEIGRLSLLRGDLKECKAYIQKTLMSQYNRIKAVANATLAVAYFMEDDRAKTNQALEKAISNQKALIKDSGIDASERPTVIAGKLLDLAALYQAGGQSNAAHKCMTELQRIAADAELSDMSGLTARVCFMQGYEAASHRQYAQAESYYSHGMQILENAYGKESLPPARASIDQIYLLNQAGHSKQASTALKKALAIIEKVGCSNEQLSATLRKALEKHAGVKDAKTWNFASLENMVLQ